VPGVFWVCPACEGRSATIGLLRKNFPAKLVNAVWRMAKDGADAYRRTCPACEGLMKEVPIAVDGKTVPLDVCVHCPSFFMAAFFTF
jgi:hypothetical protein